MTSLHYALMYGKDSLRHTSILETCLYHKLEAIKDINEMIADPEQRTSDACLLLIAGLALAEVSASFCPYEPVSCLLTDRWMGCGSTERNGRLRRGGGASQRVVYSDQYEMSGGMAASDMGNLAAGYLDVCFV